MIESQRFFGNGKYYCNTRLRQSKQRLQQSIEIRGLITAIDRNIAITAINFLSKIKGKSQQMLEIKGRHALLFRLKGYRKSAQIIEQYYWFWIISCCCIFWQLFLNYLRFKTDEHWALSMKKNYIDMNFFVRKFWN